MYGHASVYVVHLQIIVPQADIRRAMHHVYTTAERFLCVLVYYTLKPYHVFITHVRLTGKPDVDLS